MSARAGAAAGGVVVVGGGPAGLAVALHARRAGLPVTVLDRARPPIDKPCGEGLMPDGVAQLRALGVELPPAARPFRGIRYLDEQTVAEGRLPEAGLGIRRTELHAAMVHRAESLGVELCWGERVEGVLEGDECPAPAPVGVVTAEGRVIAGSWLVGADGLLSRVRRHVADSDHKVRPERNDRPGPADRRLPARRFGVRRHLRLAPWTDLVEVHWADRHGGAEAYVTPVGPETVGVAMLWSPETEAGGVGFDDLVARFPRLAERVAKAPALSRDAGSGPLGEAAPAVARGRIALVGDAGGSLDAITGEGLSVAFHQAEALVRALAACERSGTVDLRDYERAHRRIRRLPAALIRLLLFVERRPALRRRVLRALAAQPALFDRFLGVHARAVRPRALVIGRGAGELVRFAGHLLIPARSATPPRSRPIPR